MFIINDSISIAGWAARQRMGSFAARLLFIAVKSSVLRDFAAVSPIKQRLFDLGLPFRYGWSVFRHFFRFCYTRFKACHTVNNPLISLKFSNFRTEFVRCLSFLGKKQN